MRRACSACGCQDLTPLLPGQRHEYERDGRRETWLYDVVACADCGLGMVDPEPSLDLLQTFYSPDYGSYVPNASGEEVARSVKYRLGKWRHAPGRGISTLAGVGLARVGEIVTGKVLAFSLSLPLQLQQDAAILDVGFGSGQWLKTMVALGYRNLHGYDIAANAARFDPLREARIAVSSGDFLTNEYHTSFDCIRMEHVLEHLRDPVAVLNKCRGMLKPSGILVLNLPCIESWSVRASLRHFAQFDVPRHLYHHTPRSLKSMLERAGFSVREMRSYGDIATFASTLNGIRKASGRQTIPQIAFRALAPVYKVLCDVSHKGDLLTTVASPRAMP